MIVPAFAMVLFLGRGFDIYSMTDKNVYIYDSNAINQNKISINRTFTQSHYRVMESSAEANDFLNVDGELAIKVKKGSIDLQGSGSYLVKTIDRTNTVEILVTAYHETVTETFPSDTPLRTDWMKRAPKDIGTHYVRSITYGGQLIITYQMKATKSEYMQEIKAAVSANLAISGSLDAEVSGNIDKLSSRISDKMTYEIKAFSTSGHVVAPETMAQVFNMVDEYPQKVRELNGGKGSPLKVEIISLSTLSTNYTDYVKNFALDSILNKATNRYDDVRLNYEKFKDWEKKHLWNKPQQDLVNAYSRQADNAMKEFRAAITKLKGDGDTHQFDKAFEAYGAGGDNIPNKYARDLLKLQHTLMNQNFTWYPYTKAVSYYIHWGSINCSLPSSEPVYIGVAGSSPIGFGNGGTVQCLTASEPNLETKKLTSGTAVSNVNGLTHELPDGSKGSTYCAFCRLENATSVFTITGRTDCPAEMKLEYSGYLMTSQDAGTASTFICLDQRPDDKIPKVEVGSDKLAATLKPVWMVCPDCDEDENKKYVGCVVCSR